MAKELLMAKKKLGINELVDLISDRDSQKWNSLATWSTADWCTALSGEVGELCNFVKKVRRGSRTMKEAKKDISKELADVLLYICLLAKHLDINLESVTIKKFNEINRRLGLKSRFNINS